MQTTILCDGAGCRNAFHARTQNRRLLFQFMERAGWRIIDSPTGKPEDAKCFCRECRRLGCDRKNGGK